jgi:hypothetical protein
MIIEIPSWGRNKSFITATKSITVSSMRYCMHILCSKWTHPLQTQYNHPNNTVQLGFYVLCTYIFLDSAYIFIGPARFHKRNNVLYCIVFTFSDNICIRRINTISVHTCWYESSYLSLTYYITR